MIPEKKKYATRIKYSRALTEFLCEKIQNGETVRAICDKYKDVVPREKTIYDWKRKYPEFKKAIDTAYQDFFYKKIDELEELSTAPIPEGLDKIAINAEINLRRLRIDTLKFMLAKLASKLVPDLREEHPAPSITMPTINLIKFTEDEKPVKVIDHKK